MARRAYARRYAQAMFKIALERDELDRWQSDLKKIVSLSGDAAFAALLESPQFRFEDKAKLIQERLGAVNPLALNLVYLLVSRGRLGMAGEIAEEYHRLLDSHRGIEHAEAITAIPLEEEDRLGLEQRLGNIIGKKIVLEISVDSNLVGGLIVRVGGKLLDGSTRSKLLALKKELAGVEK